MPRKKSTPAAPTAPETQATSSPKKRATQRAKQKSQQSRPVAKKTTKADTTSVPSPSTQPSSSSQAVVDNTSPSQTNGQSPLSTSVTHATARRRPVLEAFIATGAAGMLMYAAMVSFYGALMVGQVDRTSPERMAGWLAHPGVVCELGSARDQHADAAPPDRSLYTALPCLAPSGG